MLGNIGLACGGKFRIGWCYILSSIQAPKNRWCKSGVNSSALMQKVVGALRESDLYSNAAMTYE